ncbi:hypothetical protein D918_05014 [Trichuris suis]|nr:hypothetical protein D918_05014 [Trichuris suis]
MTSESATSSCKLYSQFMKLSERSEELIESSLPADQTAKDCRELVKELQELTVAIDELKLYDGKERLDDVSMDDLRMLKISAYLGLLLTNEALENRMECLEKAIDYLKQYLTIMKKFSIFNDPDIGPLLVDDNPNGRDGRQEVGNSSQELMSGRERRAKRFLSYPKGPVLRVVCFCSTENYSKLKCHLERLKMRPQLVLTEKKQLLQFSFSIVTFLYAISKGLSTVYIIFKREVCLDELRLYGFCVLDELTLAKDVYKLLQIEQAIVEEQVILNELLNSLVNPLKECFERFAVAMDDLIEDRFSLIPQMPPRNTATNLWKR